MPTEPPTKGFITVHTYATQRHPTTKKDTHQARVLNVNHIVSVEEHYYTDRKLELKTVQATAIKMFGQEPIGVKETVSEVQQLIRKAVNDE